MVVEGDSAGATGPQLNDSWAGSQPSFPLFFQHNIYAKLSAKRRGFDDEEGGQDPARTELTFYYIIL